MSDSTFQRLRLMIADVCAVDPATVGGQARLRAYGLDSIRIIELMLTIEEQFEVKLKVEEMSNIASVADLAGYINAKKLAAP